jgi:hypothetical protein
MPIAEFLQLGRPSRTGAGDVKRSPLASFDWVSVKPIFVINYLTDYSS